MAENSEISWTDHTFNPWIGCTKVSDGCKFCYAETLMDKRYGKVKWGPTGTRQRTSEANWRKPVQWNKDRWLQCDDCHWRGSVQKAGINENGKFMCPQCQTTSIEPTRQRVFCASLADVFEDRPELIPWRNDLFQMIHETPNLDWLLLTKRPENINRMVADYAGDCEWLRWNGVRERTNIWIGTSVENQATADERIPHLLKVPARVRFLSCEPLLGAVDLGWDLYPQFAADDPRHYPWRDGIEWVIVGGESGHHARPMHPAWARSLRDQCQAAGVAFHFKQWGEWLPPYATLAAGVGYEDGWIAEVKSHLRTDVWFTEGEDPAPVWKVGKHAAGRLLDGREWNEFPEVI